MRRRRHHEEDGLLLGGPMALGLVLIVFSIFVLVGVVVCFCCCVWVPISMFIGGIATLATPNSRMGKVKELNKSWTLTHRAEMVALAVDTLQYDFDSAGNVDLAADTKIQVDMSKVRDSADDPKIKSWDAYYFSATKTYGTTSYDKNEAAKPCTFSTSVETSTAMNPKRFETSSTVAKTRDCSSSDPNERRELEFDYERRAVTGCESTPQLVCQAAYGHFDDSGGGDNCFFYYYLERICVVIDPITKKFTKTEGSDGIGCFYNRTFLHGAEDRYTPYRYELLKSPSTSITDYKIKFEMRSPHDPEIKLDFLSEGTFDLGMTFVAQITVGVILLCFSVPCICCVICILCVICVLVGITIVSGAVFGGGGSIASGGYLVTTRRRNNEGEKSNSSDSSGDSEEEKEEDEELKKPKVKSKSLGSDNIRNQISDFADMNPSEINSVISTTNTSMNNISLNQPNIGGMGLNDNNNNNMMIMGQQNYMQPVMNIAEAVENNSNVSTATSYPQIQMNQFGDDDDDDEEEDSESSESSDE